MLNGRQIRSPFRVARLRSLGDAWLLVIGHLIAPNHNGVSDTDSRVSPRLLAVGDCPADRPAENATSDS
jgi:hypothetical protein